MAENVFLWSITASDNDDADPAVPWPENMLPGAVNNAARSTMAAIARFIADINGTLTTTGSANAYAVTCNSGVTAFTNGQRLNIKTNFTNTASATLNLNSLGAKAIRIVTQWGEANLDATMMISGGRYDLIYDSTANSAAGAWILLNPANMVDTGTIRIWPSDTAPVNGWLFCNGQAISRTTYSGLFSILSTTYGSGDGSTTFNVPDLRGRTPFGSDDMGTSAAGRITNAESAIVGTTLGATGGFESVTILTTNMPAHTHSVSGTTGTEGAHTHSGTTGAGSAHNHTINITDPGHTHNVNSHTVLPGGGAALTASDLTSTGNTAATVSNTTGITAASVNESAHTHSFTTGAGTSHSHSISFTSGSTGTTASHNNMPPALILNFMIKV